MSTGLEVVWHDPRTPTPPPQWERFVRRHQLPRPWAWPIVRACALSRGTAVLTATVTDGSQVRALVTAGFPGLRAGPGRVPVAGLVDVECLASSSLPGIALAGEGAYPASGAASGAATGATVDTGATTESGATAETGTTAETGVDTEDDRRLRTAVVAELRHALRREYGPRVRAVMFRQVDQAWLPAVLQWPAVVREGFPISVFRNRFRSFDAYLASLSSSRRRSLRKIIQDIDTDPGIRVTFTGLGDPPEPVDIAALRALHDRVLDRHHHRWWLRRRRLERGLLEAQLADPAVHRATYHDSDGRLLAFGLNWDHPVEPVSSAWGALSPRDGGRDGLWFHSIATLIRWCIETGRAGILLGQGSPSEKRRMGCELHRQWAVLVPQSYRRRSRPGR